MRNGFFAQPAEFEIVAMTSVDTADAAAIHGSRFPRPWSDGEFDRLLSHANVYGFMARTAFGGTGRSAGFVFARQAADEAEILSIAVRQRYTRRGLAWRLMRAATREAEARGAAALYLEVDEFNIAARALYRRLGFKEVGERKSYFSDLAGNKSRALIMRLQMNAKASP